MGSFGTLFFYVVNLGVVNLVHRRLIPSRQSTYYISVNTYIPGKIDVLLIHFREEVYASESTR